MKVRIQRSTNARDWRDAGEQEIAERGARTIRVKVGTWNEAFYIFGDRAGQAWNGDRMIRVHPEDVPALASLPVRVRKTKPLDLNAHPIADLLRRACKVAEDRMIADAAEAVEEIETEAAFLDGRDAGATLCEVLATAIAGLVAEQKGGA